MKEKILKYLPQALQVLQVLTFLMVASIYSDAKKVSDRAASMRERMGSSRMAQFEGRRGQEETRKGPRDGARRGSKGDTGKMKKVEGKKEALKDSE